MTSYILKNNSTKFNTTNVTTSKIKNPVNNFNWTTMVHKPNCTFYVVHKSFGDGYGHQLLDIASGMVYHLVNKKGACYLAENPYTLNGIGHGCVSCIEMFNALNSQWPSIRTALPDIPIEYFGNKYDDVLDECNQSRNLTETYHNPVCDEARYRVGENWAKVVKKISDKKKIPIIDIALHIRLGDRKTEMVISNTYEQLLIEYFPNGSKIDIFVENTGESAEVYNQLKDRFTIVQHSEEDALYSWLLMARAKVLVTHTSSFSVSASVASEGIVFTQTARPIGGRYDGNIFSCQGIAGWWISYGHGTTKCETERLELLRDEFGKYL